MLRRGIDRLGDAGFLSPRTRAGRRTIGIAVILLGMAVVLVAAVRPTPFSSERTYWAEFDSVQGLGSIDRDIRVAGANVGEIGQVVREGDDARVQLLISDPEVEVHVDARADLRPHTLFEGSSLVDLSPGSPSAPELEQGGTIPREATTVYVSLDEALRILREPVREGFRGTLRVAARTLNRAAIAGLQRTLRNAPSLTRKLGPTARALQGPGGTELSGAIAGISDTVDDLAAEEDDLIPLARRANATLTALEVDAAQPLDRALAELPGALEELRAGAPPLARTLDGLRALSANARPAIPQLTLALRDARPLLDQARPVLRRIRPMLPQLQTVTKRISLASPDLRRVIAELLPGARTLARSVLPVVTGPTRLGQPAYVQLGSMFASATGALRPYQTAGQNPQGAGHAIRLGAYFDSQGLAASPPLSCVLFAANPALQAQLQALGLCQP